MNKKLKTLKDLPDFDYYYTVSNAPEVMMEDIRETAKEWINEYYKRYEPHNMTAIVETDKNKYYKLSSEIINWIKHFFNLEGE